MRARAAFLLFAVFPLLACPTRVGPDEQASGGKITKEDDPRVIRDSGDLYVAEAPSAPNEVDSAPLEAAGVGKPDESNGVCRLYAPKLKKPQCCVPEYGVDAELIEKTCGHQLYLGEHFRGSCGYYFLSAESKPTWLRGSFVHEAKTAKEAADSHDAVFQTRGQRPEFHSTPIPGIPGAFWSSDENLNWAFLPGWSSVRRITWRDDVCAEEKIVGLLKQIKNAKEPPKGADRVGLIPKAR